MNVQTKTNAGFFLTPRARATRLMATSLTAALALLVLGAVSAHATSVDLVLLPNGTKSAALFGLGVSSTTAVGMEANCESDVSSPATGRAGTRINADCETGYTSGDTLVFAVQLTVDAAGVNAWSVDLQWDTDLKNVLELKGATAVTTFYRGFANPTPPPASFGYNALVIESTQQSSATQSGYVHQITGATAQDLTQTITSTSFNAASVTFEINDSARYTNLSLGFVRTDGASMGDSASQFITPNFGQFTLGTDDLKRRGDFNGDGFADVLIQRGLVLYVWITDPATGRPGDASAIYTRMGPDWEVDGIADVNGDGQADVVMSNTGVLDGLIYVYITTFGTGTSGANPIAVDANRSHWAGNIPNGWSLTGLADANGDGLADFYLTANENNLGSWCNGAVYVYYSQNLGSNPTPSEHFFNVPGAQVYGGTTDIGTATCNNSDWELSGVADLNGDSATDGVLLNTGDGALYFALSGGDTPSPEWASGTGAEMSIPPADWSIVGLGAVGSHNNADLVIQNDSDGRVFVYMTNNLGTGYAAAGPCDGSNSCGPFVVPTNYSLAGIDDFTNDGRADYLMAQNASCEAGGLNPGCRVILYETDPNLAPAINPGPPYYATLANGLWSLPVFEGYGITD